MDQVQLRRILRELHFSAPLSETTAEKLAGLLSPCDFPAGATIFEEGAVTLWLYLIVAGEIGLEMCVPARGCTRILTLGPGDLLAWSSLLGDGRMTATAITLAPAKLLAASANVRSFVVYHRQFRGQSAFLSWWRYRNARGVWNGE